MPLTFQGQMHPLVASVLLRTTWLDAFNSNTRTQPPDGESTRAKQGMGRGERDTMLGSDRRREAKLPEHALEYR